MAQPALSLDNIAKDRETAMNVEKVDFAIITILPDEYTAIHARFTPEPYRNPSSHHTYGISQVQTRGGKNRTVAIARTSRQGNDASQQLANWMISDLDPGILLVVGIGGGVPDTDFTLGDVIISSHIHNFDVNAMKGNRIEYDLTGGIHPKISDITANLYLYESLLAGWNSESSISIPRPHLYLTEKRLRDLIDKDVDETWREKVEKALKWYFDKTQRAERAPKYLTGTIASSNTLVRSDAVLAQWLQDARSIRAVEMEVAGVYQAAQHIGRQYPVMAIRGISDIIGFKRDDNWKRYACHTAAAFAHAFIIASIDEPLENKTSSSDGTAAAVPNLPPVQPSNSSNEIANMPIQHSQNANTIKIFIIYADTDKMHKERLETQLSPYIWNGTMDLWDRNRIAPGAALIQQEIDKHIDSSQVILLLISPNFPASKQCLTEMTRAMQRRTSSKTIIIPIYIRPTNWPNAPFEGLLALPRSGKPVNSWSKVDEAWYNVAVDIRNACERHSSDSPTSHYIEQVTKTSEISAEITSTQPDGLTSAQPSKVEQPSVNVPSPHQRLSENASTRELLILAHGHIQEARLLVETASKAFTNKGNILPIHFKNAVKLLNTTTEHMRSLLKLLPVILSLQQEQALTKIFANHWEIRAEIYQAIEDADKMISYLQNEDRISRQEVTERASRLVGTLNKLILLFKDNGIST